MGNSTATTEPSIILESTDGASAEWKIRHTPSNGRMTIGDDPTGIRVPFKFGSGADNNLLRVGVVNAGTVDINGNLVVSGTITPDYVFDDTYRLESIEEHAAFMWNNRHLPAIAPAEAATTGGHQINVGVRAQGVLEELEKAHIYIEQLHRRILEQDRRILELEAMQDVANRTHTHTQTVDSTRDFERRILLLEEIVSRNRQPQPAAAAGE